MDQKKRILARKNSDLASMRYNTDGNNTNDGRYNDVTSIVEG